MRNGGEREDDPGEHTRAPVWPVSRRTSRATPTPESGEAGEKHQVVDENRPDAEASAAARR